ncbi:MAG TPA: hypothetical protein VGE59_02975 [Patescibacteria group bacterium]
MVSNTFLWRWVFKDRIFVALLLLSTVTFLMAIAERHPSFERTSEPFHLGLLFFILNTVFAVLALRREPLLSYMFLTASVLMNGTLFFFFRYLIIIQGA